MKQSSRNADSTSPAGIERTAIQHHAGPDKPMPEQQEWDGAAIEPAEDDLGLLAESGRKVTKVTVVLMAAVLAGLAFIGGVAVQKQWGGSSSGSAFPGGGAAMGGSMPEGMGSGGFPGGGSGSGRAGNGEQGTTDAAAATPVVVGTVSKVSGRTLTVKNFADKSVTVKVPKGTIISDSSDSALSGLAKGVSISVVGEKAEDGTVTATSITAS